MQNLPLIYFELPSQRGKYTCLLADALYLFYLLRYFCPRRIVFKKLKLQGGTHTQTAQKTMGGNGSYILGVTNTTDFDPQIGRSRLLDHHLGLPCCALFKDRDPHIGGSKCLDHHIGQLLCAFFKDKTYKWCMLNGLVMCHSDVLFLLAS
jgi:hypothetical protein